MIAPLLQSKLAAPPLRSDVVARERLLRRLEPDDATRALLVSAPAGFGKTTLVSAWLQRERAERNAAVAWLSLDAADNDERRLLRHLFAAVAGAAPPLGAAQLELLEGARAVEPEALLAPLLNDAAALERPLWIVLDDYHAITAEAVHALFDFVLEYAPPRVGLGIVSRADPPLKLARLRARAQLREVRGDDLRFTPGETSAFLEGFARGSAGAEGFALSDEDVRALTERAEGWAVGLQAAALGLEGRPGGGARSALHDLVGELPRAGRFLLDYLLDEVLARQEPEVQTFLLKTSLVDRIAPGLCAALLDPEDVSVPPAAMLERLERANLFLQPLGGERGWYRYHQLFRDVLRQRLQALHPELVAPLRRAAAEWFDRSGYPFEALEQLLAADLHPEAAELLTRVGPELVWQRGDAATLEGWLRRLPPERLAARPRLLLLRGWAALVLGATESVALLVDEAERAAERHAAPPEDAEDAEGAAPVRAEIAALRGFVARMEGRLGRALELSTAAHAELPGEAWALRGLVAGNLGEIHYLRGDLDAAHRHHEEESRLAERGGAVLPSRFALWRVADIHTVRGELDAAERTCTTMLALNEIRSVDALGFAEVQLGVIALARYRLDEAQAHLDAGIERGRQLGNPRVFLPGYGPLAATLRALGRDDEAREVLAEGLELAAEHRLTETWGVPSPATWCAYLDLRRGDLERALEWVARSGFGDAGAVREVTFPRGFGVLVAARTALADARPDDALALLDVDALRVARVVEAGAVRALALAARGERDAALDALEPVVAAAAANGHAFPFAEEGAPMRALLTALQREGRRTAAVAALLAAFPDDAPAGEGPRRVEGLEPFNERELAVLRLMAGRLSNKEIARELDLSTNTIKWYAKAIFEKLDVHGRRKAAERARELGLI